MALEALSLVGDISVSRNSTEVNSGPAWLVTFLNNAGDLPLLETDVSGLWGGVTATVGEERAGTSIRVSGSFLLSAGNSSESVPLFHNASANEVKKRERRAWSAWIV